MKPLLNSKYIIKNQLLLILSVIGTSSLTLTLLRNILSYFNIHLLSSNISDSFILLNMIFTSSFFMMSYYFYKLCTKLTICLIISNILYSTLLSYIYNRYILTEYILFDFFLPIASISLFALIGTLRSKYNHFSILLMITCFMMINFAVKYIDINLLSTTHILLLPKQVFLMILTKKLQAIIISGALFFNLNRHPRFLNHNKYLVNILIPIVIFL